MSVNEHKDWLNRHPQTDYVQAAIFDLNGVMRGKRIRAVDVEKALAGGIRMPLSVAGVDIWGEDISGSALVFETGDVDGICEHTGRGLIPITWTNTPTLLLPLWLAHDDGTPFEGDPRRALAAVLERYGTLGLTPVVATELEFYLTDMSSPQPRPQPPISPVSGQRLGNDGVLSLDELDHFEGFLNDVYTACRLQNIPADAAVSENGAGQFEINMIHTDDPLRAADDAVLFKRLVRGIARRHGFAATFMAKPYGERAGSGFHIHFSLLNENGHNIFDDEGEAGTPILGQAIAGLLDTMAQLTLIFAPHLNSYRRLTPGAHAPTAIAWAYENRTAAIRVPGGAPKARRIEHRVAGADANPYLVMAAVLGGALYGMQQHLTPPPAITGDAYTAPLCQLPLTWDQAIAAFAGGPRVPEIFSKQLQSMFSGCKKQELAKFNCHISEFEYKTYLESV